MLTLNVDFSVPTTLIVWDTEGYIEVRAIFVQLLKELP